jgi:hypothetical protein
MGKDPPSLAFGRRSPLLFNNVPYRNYVYTIPTLASVEHSDDATYIPHPCVKGAVIFSTILSIAWVPHETAWRHL